MPAKKNLKGMIFGQLTVIEETAHRDNDGNVIWKCSCSCGKTTEKVGRLLVSGNTKSCGFCNFSILYPKEYDAWRGMYKRCQYKDATQFKDWGGRGITVETKEWANFLNFLNDMGMAPSKFHSLDRKENDKGYSKSNCRWALPHEQNNNRRDNIIGRI